MYSDVNNVQVNEQVKTIDQTAFIAPLLQTVTRILVLGEASAGKTTLISACIGLPLAPKDVPATTIKFNNSDSSITEMTGLYTSNKERGQVWRAAIDFIAANNIDTVWFCVGSDFVDASDELWHWMKCLSEVCCVILVRTKCLSPSQGLSEELAQRFISNPPPVVSLLARDIQLNPKGGGAVVEAYGVDDLISTTQEGLKHRNFTRDAITKLQKQAAKDEERYAAEEAHKGAILNSLRSLSGTDESEKEKGKKTKKDSLGDEDFELVARPESPGSGFVHMVKGKQVRAVVGALVAFAVLVLVFL